MDVVHISGSLTRSAGGLFYSVSGLAAAQAKNGLCVTVVGGIDGYFAEDRKQWGDLNVVGFPLSLRYGLSANMLSFVNHVRADIVHIHGIWSANAIYGLMANWRGAKVIVSPRGMLDPWILQRHALVKYAHGALFERRLLKRAHIHALNEAERGVIETYLPSARERIFVVPNGISSRIRTVDTSKRSGCLYLGRLHAKKQVLELINCWRRSDQLAKECLTIAGWGSEDYERAVTEAVAGASNVHFVGAAYGEVKQKLLKEAKYLVLPSLSEGLPMVVLEALSMGCRPIITAQCNLPELFERRVADRLESDLSNLEDLIAAGADGHYDSSSTREEILSVMDVFNWSRIAQVMEDKYEKILI